MSNDSFMLEIEWGPDNLPDLPTKVGPFATEGEAVKWAELNAVRARWDVYALAYPYLRSAVGSFT